MTFAERVCQYCAHANAGTESRCAHCGAPLHRLAAGTGAPARVRERVVRETEKAVAGAESVAAGVEKPIATGIERFAQRFPQHWQWCAAIAAIVATVLGFVFVTVPSRSGPLVPSLPDLGAPVGASAALPEALRKAASCQQLDTASERCVVLAGSPLLAGGITGGRELSFSVTVDSPDRLPGNISRWRSAGGTVIADGPAFVAIGPSATVWYANTASRMRIETGSFTGRAGAQTFLSRSGLSR